MSQHKATILSLSKLYKNKSQKIQKSLLYIMYNVYMTKYNQGVKKALFYH